MVVTQIEADQQPFEQTEEIPLDLIVQTSPDYFVFPNEEKIILFVEWTRSDQHVRSPFTGINAGRYAFISCLNRYGSLIRVNWNQTERRQYQHQCLSPEENDPEKNDYSGNLT